MTAPDTDTLAAYCLAHGLDMHSAGETELARVWTKVEAIRAKHAAKPKGSALPVVGLDALLMDLHDLASDAYDNGKEHESGTMIRAYDTITDLEARLAAAVEVQDRLMSERYQHYLRAEKAEAERDAALAQVAAAYGTPFYDHWHRFAVVSADYSRPFLLGAYDTLEAAILAQGGKSDKWHIFACVPSPADALAARNRRDAQMRIADAKDPDKLTNYLHRRENIPAAILAAAEKEEK